MKRVYRVLVDGKEVVSGEDEGKAHDAKDQARFAWDEAVAAEAYEHSVLFTETRVLGEATRGAKIVTQPRTIRKQKAK